MRDKIARECGKIILWYIPLILIGVYIDWFWSFLILSGLYLLSLTILWVALEKVVEDRK